MGDTLSKLVSVLTPSRNQGRWLRDNIRSVASQSYPNVEHVIMDGASDDDTREVLEQAGEGVRWRSEPDQGQSDALNKAFRESKGEIIGWLNSDDAYYDPDVISDVVKYFDTHPGVAVVYGHAAMVNAVGLIVHMIWVPRWNYRLLRLHSYVVQPTVFFRRAVFGDALVDERFDFAMDRELWLRLGANQRFERIDRILAIDRNYPGRKSLARKDLQELDTRRLQREYGIPTGNWARLGAKMVKVPLRLMGARLIPRRGKSFAFTALDDGTCRLLFRQLAVVRSALPQGGGVRSQGIPPRSTDRTRGINADFEGH